MESRERRSQRDYTLAFKLSVVDQVEKGEMSYKQAQYRCVFHATWTLSPRQTGQSERSDAGVVFYS